MIGRMIRKVEHLFVIGDSAHSSSHYGIQCGGSSKGEIRYAPRTDYTTLGHRLKRLYILLQRYLFIHVRFCSTCNSQKLGQPRSVTYGE